jgi:MFS family permease
MIHALLPLYITGTLGAGVVAVGLIEGIAEATALIVKLFSGALADRTGRPKILALTGYGLAALTKPLFPMAQSLEWVIAARFIDRIGKGIRGAPRDALVAELAPADRQGEAFGLRQALDTIGAFIGPLVAVALMILTANDFSFVFWIAVLPAALSVATLFLFTPESSARREPNRPQSSLLHGFTALPQAFWLVAAIGGMMALARVSDAFLILRVTGLGVSVAYAPLILVAMNLVYGAFAYPAGYLADRMGRKTLLLGGILALIAADAVLATASTLWDGALALALWGLHMALTQGLMAAMVAAVAPATKRGTAFGVFNVVSGLAMLLGNLGGGLLWDISGPFATFSASAGVLGLTLTLLPMVGKERAIAANPASGL